MEAEKTNILLKVISAMLPYRIYCVECDEYSHNDSNYASEIFAVDRLGVKTARTYIRFGMFDIYLRPMDDIRDDEIKDLFNVMFPNFEMIGYDLESDRLRYRAVEKETQKFSLIVVPFGKIMSLEQFDWLNAHHFDYRGLIDMFLARPMRKEMYDSEHAFNISTDGELRKLKKEYWGI